MSERKQTHENRKRRNKFSKRFRNNFARNVLPYIELMDSAMDDKIIKELKTEIIHLNRQIILSHLELTEPRLHIRKFRKRHEKYKMKMRMLNLIAIGSGQENGEGNSGKNCLNCQTPADNIPTPSTSFRCDRPYRYVQSSDSDDD